MKHVWLRFIGVLLLGIEFSFSGCKKEVEKIVVKEVDKVYSWTDTPQLYGLSRVVLGMGQDANALYLHTPNYLGTLTPQGHRRAYYLNSATWLPTDINVRIPIGADFFAYPANDTTVGLTRPNEPVTNYYQTAINLRQLDRQAASVIQRTSPQRPFAAISRNNFLLFGYRAKNSEELRFVLSKVSLKFGQQLQAESKIITIPRQGFARPNIRWVVAIDDYFLVNCEDNGLYKIREDGTAKRVFGYSVTDACYKWQSVVYAVEQYNSILASTDNGETWQRFTGTPDAFNFTNYHVIGDSLVAVRSGFGGALLYTLRWSGMNFKLRYLKNDGLGQATISGMKQLGDTVYVGTTSGLFKRPVKQFFETKDK